MSPAPENHLIERLPTPDRERLQALCEPVQLGLAEVLCGHGEALTHVYFPVDGFISLLTRVDAHPGLEVGMIGREGMLGAWLVLGVDNASAAALVQGPGLAWRMAVAPFKRELARNAALRAGLGRYIGVRLAQMTASTACTRFHQIAPRLARWLLMSQDRAHADHFHVTHEGLAMLLGVRRVGITMAAGTLQRAGLIDYHRGELTVINRRGLEAASCSCYAADESSYAALMLSAETSTSVCQRTDAARQGA